MRIHLVIAMHFTQEDMQLFFFFICLRVYANKVMFTSRYNVKFKYVDMFLYMCVVICPMWFLYTSVVTRKAHL